MFDIVTDRKTFQNVATILAPDDPPPHAVNRMELFQSYAKHLEKVRAMCDDLDQLLEAIQGEYFPPIAPPRVLTAELAAMPEEKIREGIHAGIRHLYRYLIDRFIAQMDRMVEGNQVGLIQWFSSDVCRFSYYTSSYEDRILRTYEDGDEMVTETQRTHSLFRTIHDVIDAKEHDLPATCVKRPQRVEYVIAKIPQWLKGFAKIVDGQEISTVTVEIDRRIEVIRESITYDPCLIIGYYVLAGWNRSEM